jgi:LuxR family maltose regulon positive regulatory protein
VQAAIIRASSHADRGDQPNAVAGVEAALHLAEPEGLRRPFDEAPRQVRRLLRTQPRLATASAWLTPTAVAVPVPRRPPDTIVRPAAPVTVELTERELEVLQHLDRMLSTTELAAAMFISVNTVRTHIRAILRKLSATRRTDAVRYARQLKII